MELTFDAYPKINLCLYVGNKRPDGYHNLVSLFQKINNWHDTVTVSFEESDALEITVEGLEECCPDAEKSTVYKAAAVWAEYHKVKANIKIKVQKEIPVTAGLGGGSSDAGAVLLALERFLGDPLSKEKLGRLAMKVGSDVPFFVYDCEAAVVSGKGDVVVPVESRNDLVYEVFFDGQQKRSTSEAYAMLDSRKGRMITPTAGEIVYEYRENPAYWAFSNDFELLYNKPEKQGKRVFLSGAGPAWFTVQFRE